MRCAFAELVPFHGQDSTLELVRKQSTMSTEKDGTVVAKERITVKVEAQGGGELYFKVRKTQMLKKMMGVYCGRVGKTLDSVWSMFDGERIQAGETFEQLKIADNSTINALDKQTMKRSPTIKRPRNTETKRSSKR